MKLKSQMKIDLLFFQNSQHAITDWPLGIAKCVPRNPIDLSECIKKISLTFDSDYILFWDTKLGPINIQRVIDTTQRPGDVWHSGLRLGTAGMPKMIDYVAPTSMFNRDTNPRLNASSWRVSLAACLLKTGVLDWFGTTDPGYNSFLAVGLDFGYKCITSGVIVRHTPDMLNESAELYLEEKKLDIYDELRFIRKFFGKNWTVWAALRAATNKYKLNHLKNAMNRLKRETFYKQHEVYTDKVMVNNFKDKKNNLKVSVVIPTIERYVYLKQVLSQLKKQCIQPIEIIIVDQTAIEKRDNTIKLEFAELPIRIITLDQRGQSTSRNIGIQNTNGEYILFLDDDLDNLPNDLIKQHLKTLKKFNADVSSGVADELGAGQLDRDFTFMRTSFVFPAGNTLIKRSLLKKCGLFDPAFDYGDRADHDFGMRCYLSGALMILNPQIRVLHLRAPKGGLRKHGARVITYHDSRTNLWKRRIMSPTEMYLLKKYFSQLQVKEAIMHCFLGTFSIRGSLCKKILKIGAGLIFSPNTIFQLKRNYMLSEKIAKDYKKISCTAIL